MVRVNCLTMCTAAVKIKLSSWWLFLYIRQGRRFRDKRLPYLQRVSLLRSILQFLVSSFDGEDPLSVKRIIYGDNEKCLSSCTLTWIYLRN